MAPIMIRKKYGFTASATNGSNKIVACSKADWGLIKNGSFIILGDDDVFYRVLSKKKFAYEKDAVAIQDNRLEIKGNVRNVLNVDDDLSIFYTDHKVTGVIIESGGEGYEVGDKVLPQGGTYKYNSIDEIDVPAEFLVDDVDKNGGIVSLSITNGGLYSVVPGPSCAALSGSGSGALLKITSGANDTLSVESRSISAIDTNENNTVIDLNHGLPPRVQNVKLKIEKWQITISTEYSGQNKIDADYEVIKDFTPNCDLPLAHSNLNANYLIYNEAMSIIDQRLKDLEDK